jgi:pSer/pThr/pTyr-binding forkhead associated (FHA) protein
MQVRLRKTIGREGDDEILVNQWPFVIGRAPDCDLRPACKLVSRYHCELQAKGDRVLLYDLASKNGTFVDGKRVEETCEITDGTTINVGLFLYRVEVRSQNGLAAESSAQPCVPACA